MRIERHKITIVRIRQPETEDINHELQWFGTSLGLFNLRDKDRSCFRLFIELLKAAKMDTPLSSDEIGIRLGLSRGTIVHHLNTLIKAGIVHHRPQGYMLRADSLTELVNKLQGDMEKFFGGLREVGSRIDDTLQL